MLLHCCDVLTLGNHKNEQTRTHVCRIKMNKTKKLKHTYLYVRNDKIIAMYVGQTANSSTVAKERGTSEK